MIEPVELSIHAIEALLRKRFAPQNLQVLDQSAAHAGHAEAQDLHAAVTHIRIRMQATAFQGKTRVAQHRLVYDALGIFLQQGLHAIALEVNA